jgi:hypothetical protein
MIYLSAGCKMKAYKAAVSGPKAIVRIEIEAATPGDLASILEDLGQLDRDQKTKMKAVKPSGGTSGEQP